MNAIPSNVLLSNERCLLSIEYKVLDFQFMQIAIFFNVSTLNELIDDNENFCCIRNYFGELASKFFGH